MGRPPLPVVAKRRLALLKLAFEKPTFTYSEVDQLMIDEQYAYDGDLHDVRDTFRKDRKWLRKNLGVDIGNVRGKRDVYSVIRINPPVLAVFMPQGIEHLLAIAQLPQYRQQYLPELIDNLLASVRSRFGSETTYFDDVLDRAHNLAAWRDNDQITAAMRATLRLAVQQRRVIIFDYLPPRQDDELRQHLMEPYEIYVEDGHFYLMGFCRQTTSYLGSFEQNRHFDYRIGRIQPDSIQLCDETYTHQRARQLYRVHCILSEKLVKGGASQIFDQELEKRQRADGCLEVIATTARPLRAVQKLLRYGGECRVLGGDEILTRYRAEIHQMYSFYDWS